jgi:hypothetical protein
MFLRRFIEVAEPIGVTVIAMPYPPATSKTCWPLQNASACRHYIGIDHGLRGNWQRIRAWAVRNKVLTIGSSEYREMTLAFGGGAEHYTKQSFDVRGRVLRGATLPTRRSSSQPSGRSSSTAGSVVVRDEHHLQPVVQRQVHVDDLDHHDCVVHRGRGAAVAPGAAGPCAPERSAPHDAARLKRC